MVNKQRAQSKWESNEFIKSNNLLKKKRQSKDKYEREETRHANHLHWNSWHTRRELICANQPLSSLKRNNHKMTRLSKTKSMEHDSIEL